MVKHALLQRSQASLFAFVDILNLTVESMTLGVPGPQNSVDQCPYVDCVLVGNGRRVIASGGLSAEILGGGT